MDVSEPNGETKVAKETRAFFRLIFLGLCLLGLTGALAWLAQSFPYEVKPGRPIMVMVLVAWVASAVSLLALAVGLSVRRSQRMLWTTIFFFAIVCRLTLVFSNPILEVDFYRYLWDGITANQGVSPYQISPNEILTSTADDPNLKTLQGFIGEHPSAKTIVSRVHFKKFTTLYPPVSQFFFRITTRLIPDDASVETHIIAIKSMLVLFDIGVVLCLTWLLRVLKKHPAWLIAYAWNPLVLKEIANGGHLDSIAIFFFTAGVAAFLWIVKRIETLHQRPDENEPNPIPLWASAISGTSLALGIGAKLFPVVVVPALCVFLLMRKQFVHLLVFSVSCVLVSALVLWPMFSHPESPAEQAGVVDAPVGKTTDGLAGFITNWRMNDAIFSFVYQNVEYDWGDKDRAWYVVVPNETRTEWYEELRPNELANGNPAYLVARLVTMALFALFYLGLIVRLWWVKSAETFAGLLFLTMGVFFYLQPTQNPWYWLWAMPLVCFAKNRGWLIVSLVLFIYYLRFWYQEMNRPFEFLEGTYVGVDYFDHCIVWFEFFLVLTVLLVAGADRWLWKLLRPKDGQDGEIGVVD